MTKELRLAESIINTLYYDDDFLAEHVCYDCPHAKAGRECPVEYECWGNNECERSDRWHSIMEKVHDMVANL